MSDGMPEREADKALAGEYALGLLPPDEAAAFERRMASDPDLRALYADWAEDLAALTDAIDPVRPPARVWKATQASLFPKRRKGRGWLGVLCGALTASALALGLLVAVDFTQGPQRPAAPDYVAELAAEDRSLVVTAAYDAATGSLYVEREQGRAAEGRALELWLIAGDAAPVSLGLLPDEDRAGIVNVAPELRPRLAGASLAISDEPAGGSPTGAPTGDVLAVAQVTDT